MKKTLEIISLVYSPAINTPIISLIMLYPYSNPTKITFLIFTILVTVFGSIIESKRKEEDDYKFNDFELREKRYKLLAIGIIYFFLLSQFTLDEEINEWSINSFQLLSVMLTFTIILKTKISAHLIFFFINIYGISLISENFLVIPLLLSSFFLIIISRLGLKKHSLIQIIISALICILFYLFII